MRANTRSLLLLVTLPFLATGCGDGPSTSCIAAGTPVETPKGLRRIEELTVGDQVTSVDPQTGRRIASTITQIRSAVRTCLVVSTGQGRTIRATPDHPFYSIRTGRYVELAELLRQQRPVLARVAADGTVKADPVLSWKRAKQPAAVYDLSVASALHNFVAAGVLVHNKTDPTLRALIAMARFTDSATGEMGIETHDGVPASDPTAPPATLTRGTFVGGVGTLQLARSVAFDHVHIRGIGNARIAGQVDFTPFSGILLRIDPPATSTTIDVEMDGRVELLDITVVPVAADQAGPDVPRIEIPFDG